MTHPFTVPEPEAHPLAVVAELDNYDKHRLLHVMRRDRQRRYSCTGSHFCRGDPTPTGIHSPW